MGFLDYFKPVATRTAEDVRTFLKGKRPEDYNLVDVRQPSEYEQGHLPGARLIPVAEIPSRLHELDAEKPTITYCAAGVRSRAAAALLTGAGFRDVFSMQGGINAWKGAAATGAPEAGMSYFAEADRAEDLVALAWTLEEGSRRFYAGVSESLPDAQAEKLFQELAAAEERHKEVLVKLFKEISKSEAAPDFKRKTTSDELAGDLMEGGIRVSEALAWAVGKRTAEVLDLSMSVEINAYDLYVKMARRMEETQSRVVFETLAEEERRHLEQMSELLDKR